MKNIDSKLIVFFFVFLRFFSIKAQVLSEKDFQVLNVNDGLSDNDIHSVAKDTEGFMWFGTGGGLNRYDGRTFKIFRISESSYRRIDKVVSLNRDYLLIRSEQNLFLFNKKYERFLPVCDSVSKQPIMFSDFIAAPNGSCWGVFSNELSKITFPFPLAKDTAFVSVRHVAKNLQNDSFTVLCTGEDGKMLYCASKKGTVYRFTPGQRKLQKVCDGQLPSSWWVSSLLNDNSFIWISTVGDGLYGYDLTNGKLHHWQYISEKTENQLSHNDVFRLLPIGNAQYLAVTWNGYTLLSLTSEREIELRDFHSFLHNGKQYFETRMISGYYDKEGLLWIGTEGGGVLFSDLRQSFYHQYAQKRSNEICGIQMDSDGYIWLATFHKGVLRSTQPFDVTHPLSFESFGPHIPQLKTAICSSLNKNGSLWFGTKDGRIFRYGKNQQWDDMRIDVPRQPSPVIWNLLMVTDDQCWAGTSNGLYWVDFRQGTSRHISWNNPQIPDHIQVRTLVAGDDQTLWLGTGRGLLRLWLSGNKVLQTHAGYEAKAGMPDTEIEVRALLWGKDKKLWVGYAGNGLASYSPEGDSILTCYTTTQGLCSNFVTALVEDSDHSLWVGSNSGISRLSRHLQSFYNYYISGSNRSVFFGKNFLFWGNHSTLTYFRPSDLRFNYPKEKGRVIFTDLEVNHSPVQIGQNVNGQVVLPQSLLYTSKLHLTHENRNFSLSFTNLLYLSKLQKYLFRLYPYQKEWIMANEGEKISYDRLPAGSYTFQVKTIFQDQSEGDVSALTVIIAPHWSETLWFRLLIATGLVSIILIYVHRLRLKQKRIQYELRLEHELFTVNMERNKEMELRKEREAFFTMAAHELRTPLTLILSPLREILSRISPTHPFYGRLSIMFKYAEGLHTLTDRLLYIQKAEAGMVKLRLSKIDVLSLMKDVSEGFHSLAAEHHIMYGWMHGSEHVTIWADREKLSLVIQNLISNAFKYTPEGGKISLSVERKEFDQKFFCCISVTDTGKGIDAGLLQHIFEPFVTGDTDPSMSTRMGIGLKIVKHIVEMHHGRINVESKPKQGTSFFVYLPEGKSHFEEDDCTWDETSETNDEETVRESIPNLMLLQKAEKIPQTTEEGHTAARQTVLIIEDNTDMRNYLRDLMKKHYRILEAENGEEGLKMAVKQVPDLVLSDVMMPVMDGFTCCAALRKRKETAHIPILLLTAKAEDKDSVEASYRGADDYVRKPFNPEILLAKVAHLLDMRCRLKQIYTRTLLHTSTVSAEQPERTESEFMQKVLSCIESNANNPEFNVKVLAGELHMSQATLYRKLKQHTDLSAVELIRHIRMTQAAFLLMETSLSVTEVAERVGFNDLPTFRKHFMDMFGVSPSKYAENKTPAPEQQCGVQTRVEYNR